MTTVVCMKWGTGYTALDVNVLAAMVRRNLSRPHDIVCFTDDDAGIDSGVSCRPLPPIALGRNDQPFSGWRKISVFGEATADLAGPILFLDLDVVITGPIDPFFDHPGAFCVIKNWTTPFSRIGNTSVFRFKPRMQQNVLDAFERDPDGAVDSVDNEQIFVSRTIGDLTWWPAPWVRSYKVHCLPKGPLKRILPARLPAGARIIAFHGKPKPNDAIAGIWPGKRFRLPPAAWVGEHWRL